MCARKSILAFMWLLFLPKASEALILYDANSNSNSYNVSIPGSPTINDPTATLWNNVVQIRKPNGNPDASGVYLGNGFILTANHVTGSRYFIQGTEYFVDTGYNLTGSKQVTNSEGQGLDLKLVKILAPPALDGIQLMNSSQSALDSYSLYIGWGVGKGTPQTTDPATQGWTWGASSTAAERWGRNWTINSNYTFVDDPNIYLATAFDRALFASPASYNNDVFSLTLGDSGGGLFQYVGGQWMLAGVGTGVSVNGSSYYDRDSGSGGDQPDKSFFVSMPAQSQYVINAIPEPSVITMILLAGFSVFLFRGARRNLCPSRGLHSDASAGWWRDRRLKPDHSESLSLRMPCALPEPRKSQPWHPSMWDRSV